MSDPVTLMGRCMKEPWWTWGGSGRGEVWDVSWAVDCACRSACLHEVGGSVVPAQGPPLPDLEHAWVEAVMPRTADLCLPPCVYNPTWAGVQVGALIQTFSGEVVGESPELEHALAKMVGEGVLSPLCPDAGAWWLVLLIVRCPRSQDRPEFLFRASVSALGLRDGVWRGGKTHFTEDLHPRPGVPKEAFYEVHGTLGKHLTEVLLGGLQFTRLRNACSSPRKEKGGGRRVIRSMNPFDRIVTWGSGSEETRGLECPVGVSYPPMEVLSGREASVSGLLDARGNPTGVRVSDDECDPYPGSYFPSPTGVVWRALPYDPKASALKLELERALRDTEKVGGA